MRGAGLLSREFVRQHATDAAPILEGLPIEEVGALLEEWPPAVAAAGLQAMVATTGAECLAAMRPRRAAALLAELPADVAAGLLLRLEPASRERMLAEAKAPIAEALRRRLRFREGTAGWMVDVRVPSFPDQITAAQALTRVRQSRAPGHHYMYVVNRDDRLVGVLTLRQLLAAPPKSLLASVMSARVERLSATDDRAGILAHQGWRRFHALPVVDESDRFMGVIEHEMVRRLAADEAPVEGRQEAGSFGLALADLCWIGMTKIVGAVATALLEPPARHGASEERDGS